MSYVDLMYQPYASYFPYQKSFTENRMFSSSSLYDTPAHTPCSQLSPGDPTEDDTEKGSQPKDMKYLSSNCVLLTYFSGDTAAVVDEHFTRALNQSGSFSSETNRDQSPLSSRNFPPSFWNAMSVSGCGQQAGQYSDHHSSSTNPYMYSTYYGLSGLHQGHFPYSFSSSEKARAYNESTHIPGNPGSAYSSQYGSLFGSASGTNGPITGYSDFGKAPESSMNPKYDGAYQRQSVFPGISSTMQRPGKEIYWY